MKTPANKNISAWNSCAYSAGFLAYAKAHCGVITETKPQRAPKTKRKARKAQRAARRKNRSK